MKKKILKWGLILLISGLVIGGSIVLYMFNQPHRDVQSSNADYKMEAKQLVNEYLANVQLSNDKYLDEEGESKIIEVTGTISEISIDLNSQNVVLLKNEGENAGVSCTLLPNTNSENLAVGDEITIKGVIRSGAGYDEDLGLFEDVIMEKCDLITNP
ncbi:MAG: hypothetical protein IMY67_07370 [Bacteroidetes bacterium]|nr:hypothetical protein [Bacteroidota bacterium]